MAQVKTVSLGEELLQLAIEVEKKGQDFYTTAAKQVKENQVRDKFNYLAKQEKQHEGTFREMLKRLKGHRVVSGSFEDQFQYVRDVAASSIFGSDGGKELTGAHPMTDVEAINLGLQFEKDTILFYSDMRGMLPRDDQPVLDMITNEERKHLSELSAIKRQATKT